MRLGAANEDAALGSRFASLAYRYRLREHAIGVGAARIFVSSAVVDQELDDTRHFEAFGRWALTPVMHVTVSAQKLRYSGFHGAVGHPRRSATVAGVRFYYAFWACRTE